MNPGRGPGGNRDPIDLRAVRILSDFGGLSLIVARNAAGDADAGATGGGVV